LYYANHKPTGQAWPKESHEKEQGSRIAGLSAETRRLHPCMDSKSEEAELGFAESGKSPIDERDRSNILYPRDRP